MAHSADHNHTAHIVCMETRCLATRAVGIRVTFIRVTIFAISFCCLRQACSFWLENQINNQRNHQKFWTVLYNCIGSNFPRAIKAEKTSDKPSSKRYVLWCADAIYGPRCVHHTEPTRLYCTSNCVPKKGGKTFFIWLPNHIRTQTIAEFTRIEKAKKTKKN